MNDDEGPPPRLMPAPFWLALAFGLAMVLAGAMVAWLPRGDHAKPAAALTAPLTSGKGTGRFTGNP